MYGKPRVGDCYLMYHMGRKVQVEVTAEREPSGCARTPSAVGTVKVYDVLDLETQRVIEGKWPQSFIRKISQRGVK